MQKLTINKKKFYFAQSFHFFWLDEQHAQKRI